MDMTTRILWNPEQAVCTQCGVNHVYVRKFTADGSQTLFCEPCWRAFLDECNVPSGKWKVDVTQRWNSDVILRLEFEDGTTQESACWN